MTNRKRIKELILPYIVSIIAIILTLIPIYWLLITSLKKKKDSFTRPPKFIFEPTFENFIKVWNNDFYAQTIFNSLSANVHNWGKPEYTRPLTRLFYVGATRTKDHLHIIRPKDNYKGYKI